MEVCQLAIFSLFVVSAEGAYHAITDSDGIVEIGVKEVEHVLSQCDGVGDIGRILRFNLQEAALRVVLGLILDFTAATGKCNDDAAISRLNLTY